MSQGTCASADVTNSADAERILPAVDAASSAEIQRTSAICGKIERNLAAEGEICAERERQLATLAEFLRVDQGDLATVFQECKQLLRKVFFFSKLIVRGSAGNGTAIRSVDLDMDIDWLIHWDDFQTSRHGYPQLTLHEFSTFSLTADDYVDFVKHCTDKAIYEYCRFCKFEQSADGSFCSSSGTRYLQPAEKKARIAEDSQVLTRSFSFPMGRVKCEIFPKPVFVASVMAFDQPFKVMSYSMTLPHNQRTLCTEYIPLNGCRDVPAQVRIGPAEAAVIIFKRWKKKNFFPEDYIRIQSSHLMKLTKAKLKGDGIDYFPFLESPREESQKWKPTIGQALKDLFRRAIAFCTGKLVLKGLFTPDLAREDFGVVDRNLVVQLPELDNLYQRRHVFGIALADIVKEVKRVPFRPGGQGYEYEVPEE